jgi:hypothetical protein
MTNPNDDTYPQRAACTFDQPSWREIQLRNPAEFCTPHSAFRILPLAPSFPTGDFA